MQKLSCPSCAADIPAASMNIAETIAVCPSCDTVFDFGFIGEQKAKKKAKRKQQQLLHPPKGLRITEKGDGFELSWRWFAPFVIFFTFFVVVWDAFLIFWYRMALGGTGFGGADSFDAMMLLFPLVHVAVGIGMTYHVLATYLNRTTVQVSSDRVRVHVAPVPYPWKNRTLSAADIEQAYVKKSVKHGRKSTTVNYEVRVRMFARREETLVSTDNPEFALFIEQEIEAYLGIEDAEVYGEYSGN